MRAWALGLVAHSGSSSGPVTNPIPVEDEELSTHQEAVPVPSWWGTRHIALRWLAPAYDMITEQAPDDQPGKKG